MHFSLPDFGLRGDIAQLVERIVRNDQVRGSNPLISTIFFTPSGDGTLETGIVPWAVPDCPGARYRPSTGHFQGRVLSGGTGRSS